MGTIDERTTDARCVVERRWCDGRSNAANARAVLPKRERGLEGEYGRECERERDDPVYSE